MTTKILLETLDLSEATFDSDARVIKGVVLIRAGMSKNRRYYGEDVLQNAVTVFEGSKAFVNHPSPTEIKERRERNLRDLSGWYSNVRYEGGALRADRYFSRTQAGNDAFAIAEDVVNKRAPASLAGLSINAVGTGKMDKFDDGEALRVESITAALSVDDVASPAAGGAYALTASSGDELLAGLLESLTFEEWQTARNDYVERLKKEWKTIRLEEETKRVLAEADEKVKAAETKAVDAQQALHEAQASLTDLTQAHEATVTELATARRALAIEQALRRANLPALYEGDLRDRLLKCDPAEWAGVIETEQRKARRTGDKIPVTGAPVVESAPPPAQPTVTPSVVSLYPQDNETADEWRARIARMKPQATLQ